MFVYKDITELSCIFFSIMSIFKDIIEKMPNKLFLMFCNCLSKLCYQMFDLFFVFSALFLRTKSRGKVFLLSCSQKVENSS